MRGSDRGIMLCISVLLGVGLAVCALAVLQPARAAIPECAPLYAAISAQPQVTVLTGTAVVSEATLTWDGAWAVYAVNVQVDAESGAAFTLGALDAAYFTMAWDSLMGYDAYLNVDVQAVGGAAAGNSRVVAGDMFGYGASVLVDGLYGPETFTGGDDPAIGAFYLRLDDTTGAGTVRLVGTWKVAVVQSACLAPPFLATPAPAPDPGGVDFYNLPGDYGTVGRLFDFGVILAVAQGFIDFIGVDNLRDWIALGAALAVLFTTITPGDRTTLPPQS